MVRPSILWRRLDTPGHDACRLEESPSGWTLDGMAVFLYEGAPAWLAYQIVCDPAWRTRQGRAQGWLGTHSVEFKIARTSGGWTLNGEVLSNLKDCADQPSALNLTTCPSEVISSLNDCIDLHLGFTPATNILPLRRLNLAQNQAADAPVAWLNLSTGSLEVLLQRYERRSESTYWYEAPSVGYAALLEVTPTGFIRRYPGLWEAEM